MFHPSKKNIFILLALLILLIALPVGVYLVQKQTQYRGKAAGGIAGEENAFVYVLNGNSLEARSATINGFSIDTSTVESIKNSVAAITPKTTEVFDQPPAGSYDIEVNVDTSTLRPIHPLFFGFGLETISFGWDWATITTKLRDPRLPALLSKLRPGLIRYPSGTFGRIYWDRDNTGSYPLKITLRAQDLDDLVTLCRKSGATLFIEIPLNLGDEGDWGDFADYCNEKGYTDDVIYISAGNENNTHDGWSSDKYVENFKPYYDAMRAVKSEFIFGAPEACCEGAKEGYIGGVLQRLSMDNYDIGIVTDHIYHLWRNDDTVEDLLRNLDLYTTATQTLTKLRNQYYPEALTMWTEFGPTVAKPDYSVFTSVGTALWAADVLGRVARAGGDGMLFYSLTYESNFSWPSMLFTNDFSQLYPLTYLYLMFGQWWGDDWVLDVNSTDETKMSVVASVNDERMHVMLINKVANEDLSTRVRINAEGKDYYLTYPTKAHSITLITFPTPTLRPTATPTPTPTPTPTFVPPTPTPSKPQEDIFLKVTYSFPQSSCGEKLAAELSAKGTDFKTSVIFKNGQVEPVALTNIKIGQAYDFILKAPMHLSVKKSLAILQTGDNYLDFGPLLAGDIAPAGKQDDFINSLDWSVLVSWWGKEEKTADLNCDGAVNALDASLILNNFFKEGAS